MSEEYVAVYSLMSGAVHNDCNLTLKKHPDYHDNFAELYEKQSRTYELLLGYLLILHYVISISAEIVAQKLEVHTLPLYEAILSELEAIKERLLLLKLLDATIP